MRTKKLTKRTSRAIAGFTLIELMIVVAIIGILAAVAIPNFLKARDKAKFTQCVQMLTGLKVAEEMYISDWGEYMVDNNSLDLLATYMIPGCVERDGSDCAGDVLERINTNCERDTFTFNDKGTPYEYEFQAEAKDRWTCGICMSAKGYLPENYAICSDTYATECPQ